MAKKCQTPGFVHSMVKGHLMLRLDRHSEPHPMRRLQEATGKSARLRPAKSGLIAFHTVGEACIVPSSL